MFTAVLSGWDRLRLCGTLRPLFNPKWMRAHLGAGKVLLKDFQAHAQGLTGQIHTQALAAALAVGRPYRFMRTSRTSKEAVARELVQRDRVRAGLVTVLGAVEPCVAMTVRFNRETGRLEPRLEDRKALHLYHYFMDEQFGLCHVRVQTWYPFTVEVWVNGREWLARQMDEAGLAYVRRDNCFTHLDDPQRAQSLCDAQPRADWPRLLHGLLERAHPLHATITRPLNLKYYWTALQSEHATDLICPDAGTLARIYPAWVRHGLHSFGCVDVMRFLGHRVPAATGRDNGRFQAEALTSYQHRPEGVRLKHWVGQSVRWEGKRFRGLHLFAAPETAVLTTVNRGEYTVEGFRNADLQRGLFEGAARTKKERTSRSAKAGRWLRLLRAHGLIRKVPGRHRYLVSEKGREIITLVLSAHHADVEKLSAIAA